eukprot:Ihof_evm5s151 gene=Ihof_evmTU5s151
MSEKLTFENICLSTVITPANNLGTLKMAGSGIAWRTLDKQKTITVMKENMQSALWRKAANGYELKVLCKDGLVHRLDGFEDENFSKIQLFFKNNFEIEIGVVEQAVKGFHWGDVEVKGPLVNFMVDGKAAFDVPISEVSQSVLSSNKMEVSIELQQPEKQNKQEMLYEMRFFFTRDPDKDVAIDDDDEEKKEAQDTRAQKFHKRLAEKTDKSRFSGDSVATFPEMLFLTPRGKYQMEFFPKFVKLRGPTHNYNVMYNQIQRIFLLPKPDGFFYVLALLLDPPVRQGQTTYPFLIVQIPKEEETNLEFNLSEEQREEKFAGKLTVDSLKGLAIETLPRLLKVLANKKVVCASAEFKAMDDSKCLKCALKASSGVLYPLENGILFIHKPAIYVRYADMSLVTFDRQAGSSARSFELIVNTKNDSKHNFTNLAREEFHVLSDFFKSKNINCEETEVQGGMYSYAVSDGANNDGYMNRVQGEGDDDESEDDEDFNPGESESDVAEEFDSQAEVMSSGSDGEGGPAASTHEAGKKEKKRKADAPEREKEGSTPKKPKTVSGEKKKKKEKRAKDLNAPKKPLSTYMMFCNEIRDTTKAANPELSMTELVKKMSEEWKLISEDQKQDYKKKYDTAMEEWRTAMTEYEKTKPVEEEEEEEEETTKKPKK